MKKHDAVHVTSPVLVKGRLAAVIRVCSMHRVFRRQFNYSDLSQKQTSGDEDVINGAAETCHLVILLSVVLQINMTHLIKHLSFGKDYPGIVNPLDDTDVTAPQGQWIHGFREETHNRTGGLLKSCGICFFPLHGSVSNPQVFISKTQRLFTSYVIKKNSKASRLRSWNQQMRRTVIGVESSVGCGALREVVSGSASGFERVEFKSLTRMKQEIWPLLVSFHWPHI